MVIFANTVVKNNQLIMDNLFNNTKEFDDVVHISTTAVSGYGSQPSNKVVKKEVVNLSEFKLPIS